ncbi:M48 family metallopeptidase [Thiocystis violacea]|uniref:M48 family metallopeptidase n=2 Tax=Pseudomonadota TaxID=1224 RepID=UPI0019053B1B|nr:M48 family metallopeptidase [Thiocystis violacea]MBK1716395.1 peptidase M48 [Thiocystis violacea]
MNFFEHQARARRRTWGLLALFALALVCIVALVDLVALLFFGSDQNLSGPDVYLSDIGPGLFARHIEPNLALLFWVSVATLGAITLASQWRILTLRGGGGTVARGLGGTLVTPDTTDPLRRRLRHVVEEMAIASGVPVPEIYLLEQEAGINAFAAGYTPADAAVAVTQGALETLSRAELQGVIAHEFGHILNGDMRLNIRLMGVLFGILVLALLGRFLLSSARLSARRDGRGVLAIGLALVAVGYVGLFFGRLIQASVSRQREFLADASAVRFTREPSGIAGALKKIGAAGSGSVLTADTEEVAHMLFAKGLARPLFATHPPLVERIRAIEPGFDPRELTEIASRMRRHSQALDAETETEAPAPAAVREAAPGIGGLPLTPERVLEMGAPGLGQVMNAGLLAAAIPRTLERAAHTPEWAPEVICYLLMSEDPEIRERQLAMVAEALGLEAERQVDLLRRDTPILEPALRIPLLEICFPALRRRPEQELAALSDLVERLIHADDRVDLFEYVLAKLLARYLADRASPATARIAGRGQLADATPEVVELLSLLAHHGHEAREAAHAALLAGIKRLGAKPEALDAIKEGWLESEWLGQGWSRRLDRALARLDQLRLEDKQRLLGAMAATVIADGRVVVAELELLRAICATLRMPLPVFTPAVDQA